MNESNKKLLDNILVNARVLVVDDNAENLRFLSKLLSEEGYSARPANSGPLALESIRNRKPDLILLDIKMPGMDGYEVCRQLKADEQTREIPIVFLSALDDPVDKVRAFDLGGVDYITKPIQREELLARVRTHVNLYWMQTRLEEMVREKTTELVSKTKELQNEIVERKRAEEALLKKQREIEAMLVATRAVPEKIIFGESARSIFDAAKGVIGADSGYVALLSADDQENEVLFLDAGGRQCTVDHDLPMPIRGLRGEVYREGRTAWENNFRASNYMTFMPEGHVELDNVLFSPILINKKVAGTIGFANKPGGFTEEDARIAASFADIAAVGLRFALNQESLQTAETKYRTVANFTYDWETWVSPDGEFLYASPSCERITGYTSEEYYGNSNLLDEIIVPEDHHIWEKHRHDIETVAGLNEVQFHICRKDGSVRWIEHACLPVYDEQQNYLGLRGSNHDITDRKQVEEEVGRLAMAVEQADEIVVITDKSGTIEYVNPAFERVTGYSSEEAVGKNPKILKSGKHSSSFYAEMWRTILDGGVWKGRLINRRKDESLYEEDATISPLKNESGEIINFVAVKRDVTREALLERQISQSQKMEAIGTLAGGIAHDFNNILSAVFGFTELAMNYAEKGSQLADYLYEVITAGRRAKDLVKQILAFSRQSEQELKPVQIKLITKEVLKLLRASLPSTVEIRQDIQSDALVMSDPTQVHQILMNLCTNAAHAMQEKGGVLGLELKYVELDSAFTAIHPDIEPGPYVQLTVSDTGHGMSPEIIDRIFDPFYTTKGEGEGTGMGLSVVHGIVKNYGGLIHVYSEIGKGSTFKIFLPAIEKRLAPEERIERLIPKGTERILFVDDEQPLLEIGKRHLESLGYEVTTRISSVEALDLFKSQPEIYNLVITDMTMPSMTGDELAKKLMAVRPDIPVIICTGFNARITEQKAKNIGIRALVPKPILKRDLAETIRRVLDEK